MYMRRYRLLSSTLHQLNISMIKDGVETCIFKKALDEGNYILLINYTYITYKLNT